MRTPLLLLCGLALAASAAQAPSARAQSPLSQLHDALHLTPAQEDAWRAYQRSTAADAEQAFRARQAEAMLPGLPTPRRLALVRAQMQADLASFDRTAQAVSAFYAALGPEQQRTFDRQTAPPTDTARQPPSQPPRAR